MTITHPLDLERLKNATDLSEIAAVLGVRPAHLSFALYLLKPEQKYHTFRIPKKRGGERIISAPDGRLKYIQKQLADILLRIELAAEAAHHKNAVLAHGFKKELSIVTNAARHRNKRFVFNIDLEDFFPSINFGRVRGFFISNSHFALSEKASTVLAQIACHDNQLPQGSPCSPPISNLIANILDIRLNKLARRCRCTYSRYADDITFSTNEQSFPDRIAVLQAESRRWLPSDELISRIRAAGFAINSSKTRMQYRDSRQDATGLIVNRKLNVPVDYYKATRAMCHRLFTKGEAQIKFGGKTLPLAPEKLRGRLGFIYYIRSLTPDPDKSKGGREPNYRGLYARFLNYVSFWGIKEPTIVCEGKTDTIYIRSAIRALRTTYPAFFQTASGKERIGLTFFKYTKIAKAVQDLSGGNGQLKNLVHQYKNRTKGFEGWPAAPVIIVTDVDKGATELFKAMSVILEKSVGGEEPWYYVDRNLYVVPIPKKPQPETAIEDLFEPGLLDTELHGKKFDRTNHEKDGDQFYSKFTFATQVIAASKSPINYEGFKPLLQAILDVKADYAKRVSAPKVPKNQGQAVSSIP